MAERYLVVALCLALTGCGTFPTNITPPYSQEQYLYASPGKTREEVTRRLGQPHLRLQGDRFWVYGRTWVAQSGLGEYDHDYRAMLVEFRDGKVNSREVFQEKFTTNGGCWGSGLCLHPVWDAQSKAADEPRKLSRRYSAVTSLRSDDSNAKLFTPAKGHCLVYVYSADSIFRRTQPPVLTLDGIKDEPVPAEGYQYLQSLPGQLTLRAGKRAETIDCQSGAIHFYKLTYLIVDADGDIDIKSEDVDEGRKAVMERRLLINWN